MPLPTVISGGTLPPASDNRRLLTVPQPVDPAICTETGRAECEWKPFRQPSLRNAEASTSYQNRSPSPPDQRQIPAVPPSVPVAVAHAPSAHGHRAHRIGGAARASVITVHLLSRGAPWSPAGPLFLLRYPDHGREIR